MFSAFFLLPLEQRPAREREAGGSPAATTTEPPPACGSFRLANGTARQRSEDGDRMEEESAAALEGFYDNVRLCSALAVWRGRC